MEVEEVLSAAASGPAELSRLLDQRPGEITEELAAAVSAVASEALDRQDGETVLESKFAASQLYLRLGDRRNGLKCYIEFNGALYTATDSFDTYISVRAAMLDTTVRAREIDAPDLAFRAALVAAESGFHALEGAADRDQWRLTVFADIEAACEAVPATGEELSYQRLVYLIAAAVNEAMGSVGAIEGPMIEVDGKGLLGALRRQARWVEERVPVDFEYGLDPKTNAEIATQLATLTDRFG